MSAKDKANRIFHFIVGLILTIVGIFLVIFEFSGSKGSDLSFAPFLILFFGLGWIGFAFDKHKKAQKLVADKDVPVPPENNPAPVLQEQNPVPTNQAQ